MYNYYLITIRIIYLRTIIGSYLPGVSNWDTSNVTSFFGMFEGCSSVDKLPDTSN